MKKIAVINKYNSLNQNQKMFYGDTALGTNLNSLMPRFKSAVKKLGYLVYSPENFYAASCADIVIFIDPPGDDTRHFWDIAKLGIPTILIEAELPNWLPSESIDFECDLTLTYRPREFTRNAEYFSVYCIETDNRPDELFSPVSARPEGFSLLGTNHYRNFGGELYSYRRELATFLTVEYPELFSLGGVGWERASLKSLGRTENKLEFLRKRQFNICVENCHTQPGYVTEKLLECIYAGAIPIYYSDGHDAGLVPDDLYVNAADFESPAMIFHYCMGLSEQEREQLVARGWQWLCSSDAVMFQVNHQVELLVAKVDQLLKTTLPDHKQMLRN